MNSKIGNIMVKDIDDDKIDVFLSAKMLKKKKNLQSAHGKVA
jgi:hypothetical protein